MDNKVWIENFVHFNVWNKVNKEIIGKFRYEISNQVVSEVCHLFYNKFIREIYIDEIVNERIISIRVGNEIKKEICEYYSN